MKSSLNYSSWARVDLGHLVLLCCLLIAHVSANPLSEAIKNGWSTEEIEGLLQEPSSRGRLNTLDKDGVSPLMLAVMKGEWELVELLVRHGAQPTQIQLAGDRYTTPLWRAIEDCRPEERTVRILLKHSHDLNLSPVVHINNLIDRFPMVVPLLIAKKIDLTLGDYGIEAPLLRIIYAVHNEQVDVNVLENALASQEEEKLKEVLNKEYKGALREVIRLKAWNLLELLIAYGADILKCHKNGKLGLLGEVLSKDIPYEILEAVLRSRPENEVRECLRGLKYILNHAILKRKWDAVALLLEYGADVRVDCKDGQGPISVAIKNNVSEELLEKMLASQDLPAMREYFSTSSAALQTAILHKRWDFIPLLLKYGANPLVADEDGHSPQIIASSTLKLHDKKGPFPDEHAYDILLTLVEPPRPPKSATK